MLPSGRVVRTMSGGTLSPNLPTRISGPLMSKAMAATSCRLPHSGVLPRTGAPRPLSRIATSAARTERTMPAYCSLSPCAQFTRATFMPASSISGSRCSDAGPMVQTIFVFRSGAKAIEEFSWLWCISEDTPRSRRLPPLSICCRS